MGWQSLAGRRHAGPGLQGHGSAQSWSRPGTLDRAIPYPETRLYEEMLGNLRLCRLTSGGNRCWEAPGLEHDQQC